MDENVRAYIFAALNGEKSKNYIYVEDRMKRTNRKSMMMWKRAAAWFLSFAMVLTLLQTRDVNTVTLLAAENNAYVFDPSAMTLAVQSDKRTESEQETIGGYFTFTTGLTKAGAQDASGNYTIVDTYGDFAGDISYSKRFSTQGSAKVGQASIGFTVSEKAESAKILILAAVDSGKEGRGVSLWTGDGASQLGTLELTSDGAMGVLVVEGLTAGSSYYFGSYNSGIYIYYAKVIECVADGSGDSGDGDIGSGENGEEAEEEENPAWNAAKTGSFSIGNTVYTITSGASETDDFAVSAQGDDGFVEVTSSQKAIIWANLGGDGNGVLNAAGVTNLKGNISSISANGNELTVALDGEGAPASYTLLVKDSSATGTPKADGSVKTYSMQDESVVSSLYTSAKRLTGGVSVFSTDKLLTLTGNNKIYYHGAQHGIVIGDGDTIQVKVAGNAEVTFALCAYSQAMASIHASTSEENGRIYAKEDESTSEISFQGASDGATAAFVYEGDAATLTFTVASASGDSYLHSVAVCNEAPETAVNPDAVSTIPEVIEGVGTATNLSAQANGQKLTLTQMGGAMTTVDGAVNTQLSYYAFPDKTSEFYRIEADIQIVETEGSGNNYGLFFGAFDENYVALAGIRNKTNIRGIYSKSAKDMLGAGQANQTMTAGEILHLNAYKKADAFYIETSCAADGLTYTSKYKYNATDFKLFTEQGANTPVYYGFVASGVTAVVTNLRYYDAKCEMLFDQNEYYLPLGTAPVVTGVRAVGDESREFITVNWSGEAVSGDGKYVLQVSKDGGEFVDVAVNLTEMSYRYPVTEAGRYTFRVCGTLGTSEEQALTNRNEYVTSEPVEIMAALTAAQVSVPYVSATSGVEITWTEVAGAERYEVYRRSSDETESIKIAEVTTNTYTDTAIEAEVPYYYSVQAFSSNNYSNLSEETWTLPTNGHTGDYVYENGELVITKKSYDTVYDGNVWLEGIATEAGTVTAYVNGEAQASVEVGVRGAFCFSDLSIAEGRNDVTLILTKLNGTKVRKSFNFVYLTNCDMVVDAAYTGENGAKVNGMPHYATVQAAIDAVPSTNTERKVILIKAGDYEEKNSSTKQLMIDKPYVSLIGEDSEMVRLHNQPLDLATEATATTTRCFMYVKTSATGFTAENLTVENDWEYRGDGSISNESADAILTEAEGAIYSNVHFLGYQDTINPNKNHQYFYKCYITGNVDFIYGSAGMILFDDCDIVFRYNANKNSGYVTAPKSDGVAYGLIFNDCRITAEKGCSGSKYYLGRPWGETAAVTYIDCYMGSVINKQIGWTDWSGKELSTNATALEASRYYECGTYGPGYAVNANRRQISRSGADTLLSAESLGWSPYTTLTTIGTEYEGDIVTDAEVSYVEKEYVPDSYSGYESDDTGAGRYDMEGFAASSDTTGGGLLYEISEDYYKVSSAEEFLDTLLAVKTSGMPSVIELTADICLGDNEVENFADYSSVITSHTHPALTHPVLIESGVSKLAIKGMSDLTIFSKDGYSIKHAAIDINGSENIIIRNIRFDELWEWDEETAGDYDVNDWDYVTVQAGSDRIWIDHCSFYKAYDGVVDIKTDKSTATNVTVSWCEFLPGSEENVFFNEMMSVMAEHPENYPYYQSLLEADMSEEQIWWYAYGQKKTHLVGQSDDATQAVNINLTLANNYYYDSMDRMPRMRYGTAHVYNCIMDAQELLEARNTIADEEVAKHIVSNGASSTCNGEVLLENCYISGIINVLNSGNGSSPSGYINAINSLYYMYGERYALTPKVNTTKEGENLKVLDAETFVAELPYEDYTLYSASELADIVKVNAGAGKQNWSALQWEKTEYYDTAWEKPVAEMTSNDGLNEYNGETGKRDDAGEDENKGENQNENQSQNENQNTAGENNGGTTNDSGIENGAASNTQNTWNQTTIVASATSTKSTQTAKTVAAYESTEVTLKETKKVTFRRAESDWDKIKKSVEALLEEQESAEITLIMPMNDKIPTDFWNEIAGKPITLMLELEDGITWRILGENIAGTIDADLNMTVCRDGGAIPKVMLEGLETDYVPLSLAHDGEFGFEASMYVTMDENAKGMVASLFYYNEASGEMEYVSSSAVNEEGRAIFNFSHASDYVILLAKGAVKEWRTETSAEQTGAATATASVASASNVSWMGWGVALVIAILVMGGIVLVYRRKRHI